MLVFWTKHHARNPEISNCVQTMACSVSVLYDSSFVPLTFIKVPLVTVCLN